jgi:hypothetical protein
MGRHLTSTRGFPHAYSQAHPYVTVADTFPGRPCKGGALVMAPLPAGLNGQPYFGMDPSAPATWVRPWNPQPGMVARLNFDGAKMQGDTPMAGTWRNPQRDRADVRARRWWGRNGY